MTDSPKRIGSTHPTSIGGPRDVAAPAMALCADRQRSCAPTRQGATGRTQSLDAVERKRIALQELIAQGRQHNLKIGKQIMANVETIIMPMVQDIAHGLPPGPRRKLAVLAEALKELTSPLADTLASGVARLSPVEIRICRLLKGGMSTKDIAAMQHISPATVSKHRENIRRKLGITGKKVNLASHLSSLLQP